MNRPTTLLALLCLTACTPTPSTPKTSSPAPAASTGASASTAPTASSPTPSPAASAAAKGGALHFDITDASTAQPNPGTSYDAVQISGTSAANGLAAGVFAHADHPARNFNFTLGTSAPKAGESYPLQNTNLFAPGYLQYAQSDDAIVQPKTYLWSATSGTLKVDAVDGKTVSFSYVNAVMSPKNDTGNPNNATSVGTFTLNGSGKVELP